MEKFQNFLPPNHSHPMESYDTMPLCELCGETLRDLKDVKTEEVFLDPALILKNTLRALNINDNFSLLDEETGLVTIPGQFCFLCIDRARTLNQLFTQIDALNDHVNQIREIMEKEYLTVSFNENGEIEGSQKISPQPKLRRFIWERIWNRQPLLNECNDFVQLHGVEDHFRDDVKPQDKSLHESYLEENKSCIKNTEEKSQQEHVKTPSTAPLFLLTDASVLVKRLSQEEIAKYTKKGGRKTRKRKKNPIILERKVKKLQKELEAKQSRFYCQVENCSRKSGFHTKALLECHVAKKHEGLTHPYTCEECNRKFRQPKLYEMHLKTHQGDYPFFCEYCGVGFLNSWSLGVHSVRHTGEMPYKCKLCPKTYKGHNGLKYHVRMTHTKEKPYTCDSCGKNFARMDKLKRHIHAVHQTERPWVCDLCGKSFSISNYLYMHKRSVHDGHSFKVARNLKLQAESGTLLEGVATIPNHIPEGLPEEDHLEVLRDDPPENHPEVLPDDPSEYHPEVLPEDPPEYHPEVLPDDPPEYHPEVPPEDSSEYHPEVPQEDSPEYHPEVPPEDSPEYLLEDPPEDLPFPKLTPMIENSPLHNCPAIVIDIERQTLTLCTQ